MKAHSYRLLVVAHPDDETIFFGGLVQNLRSLPWHVVCITDGNADGRGLERNQELKNACKTIGIKSFEQWEYPDHFDKRLPVAGITERLKKLPLPKEVYTHGPLGEYGHAHHQDISLATHRAFAKKCAVTSPAWNCVAEKIIKLTPSQFKKKTKAYAQIYPKEAMRFVNILPNSGSEAFRQFSLQEVEALVGFFRREKELEAKKLKAYRWLAPFLPDLREKLAKRLF